MDSRNKIFTVAFFADYYNFSLKASKKYPNRGRPGFSGKLGKVCVLEGSGLHIE